MPQRGKQSTTTKRSSGNDGGSGKYQRGPRGGMGWLLIFVVAGGLLAVYIFAPDLPRQLLGGSSTPRQLGDEPVATQDQEATVSSRQVDISSRTLSGAADDLAVKEKEPAKEVAAPIIEDTGPEFKDAIQGASILAKAEKAYASYQWNEARSLANSMRGLDIEPELKLRIDDIIEGTKRLEALFATLGTREELVRNLETHPSLVQVTVRGQETLIIPISDMSAKTPIETDDPVTYIQDQLAAMGEVPVMQAGKSGITYKLKSANVTSVVDANVEKLIADRTATFESRVSEFEQDAEARTDPMAWYEAAKFAYRNRIDGRVVEMLDRALLLSPDLGQDIREDAAQEWFTKMVMASDGGNSAAVKGFMAQITKYKDTLVFEQAQAYYQGNMAALREARSKAVAKRSEQRKEARSRRLERAKRSGDEETVAKVEEQIKEETVQEEQMAAPPASGDIAFADAEFDKAMEMYARAQAMPATRERDALYKKTRVHFINAMNVYAAEVEAGNSSLEAKMTRASQLQFACMKYARTF